MESLKKLNERSEKWRQMLASDLYKDPKLLKKRIRKGIPPNLRKVAWPRIIDLESFKRKSKYTYKELLKKETISAHDICLDVPRTFPEQEASTLRNSLYSVLKCISIVHPEIGYCQGMNFLTMRLLEVLDDQSAFWMMDYLLQTHQNLSRNYKCPESVQMQNHIFSKLLQKHLKQVYKVCEEQMISPLLYTTPWYITYFSSIFPKELFCRVFECILSEGYKIIYRVGLAIMKVREEGLLNNGMENNIVGIGKGEIFGKVDADEFVQSMFGFSLARAEIQAHEDEYRKANQKKIQKMELDCKLAYQKRLQDTSKTEEIETETMDGYEINIKEYKKAPFHLIQID